MPEELREDPPLLPATAIGSMPGTDSAEATRIVIGELDVPHVVELPARGPGGEMIGRTLGLLTGVTGDFAGETTPSGWRLVGGRTGGDAGRAMRRAASWLGEDLDHLDEATAGFRGSVKLQVVGPWTLAAAVETARGTRLLADAGACADLASALAHTVGEHVNDVHRRLPGARIVVQLDEPTLPVVLAGRIRTPSGRGAVRTPGAAEVERSLLSVTEAVRVAVAGTDAIPQPPPGSPGSPGSSGATAASGSSGATGGASTRGATPAAIVHCCARQVPFDLFRRGGFDAVSVDLAAVGAHADEGLGRWWDGGGVVVLGAVPATDPVLRDAALVARTVEALWRRIGFDVAEVGERTWLSPACGLAGASPQWARETGGLLRTAARLLSGSDLGRDRDEALEHPGW